MPTKTRQVFLSYSRDEAPFVRAVEHELRVRGVDLAVSRDAIEAGASWQEQMSDALVSSGALIVFIGRDFESPWVNFEIGAAVGQQKPILPVYLTAEGAEAAPAFVSQLRGIDAHDLKPDQVAEEIAGAIKSA